MTRASKDVSEEEGDRQMSDAYDKQAAEVIAKSMNDPLGAYAERLPINIANALRAGASESPPADFDDWWKRQDYGDRELAESAYIQGRADQSKLSCERPDDAKGDAETTRRALEKIERWFGEFPETNRFWDEPKNKEPMSYAACFGSNGERDYMREVARNALAPVPQSDPVAESLRDNLFQSAMTLDFINWLKRNRFTVHSENNHKGSVNGCYLFPCCEVSELIRAARPTPPVANQEVEL